MADLIFEDSKLVSIYDAFDGERNDLSHYVSIIEELKVNSILDIGCGTGSLLKILIDSNYRLLGIDPALESLKIAKKKCNNDGIQWIHGETNILSTSIVDLAIMTGNVAQVFTEKTQWIDNLRNIYRSLNESGYLVFEVRDPERKAWKHWNRTDSYQRLYIQELGFVEGWVDLVNIKGNLVSFRWSYNFESDNKIFTSDSTLIFRKKQEIIDTLQLVGFSIFDIRDAPDRKGDEFVFIAQK